MLQDNRTKRISPTLLPDPILAADMYRNGGGRLTDPEPYGLDPIANDLVKEDIRKKAFFDKYDSFDNIFNQLVNERPQMFKEALLFYINVTKRLSH